MPILLFVYCCGDKGHIRPYCPLRNDPNAQARRLDANKKKGVIVPAAPASSPGRYPARSSHRIATCWKLTWRIWRPRRVRIRRIGSWRYRPHESHAHFDWRRTKRRRSRQQLELWALFISQQFIPCGELGSDVDPVTGEQSPKGESPLSGGSDCDAVLVLHLRRMKTLG